MTPTLEIVRTPRPTEAAAERLARAIARVDAQRGACRLAIPGGSALAVLPHVLKDLPQGTWSRVQLTWVDERCVPASEEGSNRGSFLRLGLPPPGAALPLWTDDDADPAVAVARYGREFLRAFAGGLDVALLGLGEDGHVASLFPGHAALQAGGAAVFVADSPKPPPRRMSLTLPVLRATPLAVMMAAGAGKRAALRRVIKREEGLPTTALAYLVIATDIDSEGESDE
ncbi:6-phosphogluconolactonase [Nannocystis exedens]|uniref:6-phosphogluconolactonase n=1 Tax=Nannocystis exedens TaxID=54 RepID=A0A1I1X6S4_9BACT|nr:6-phosphogluconolactonase [Nannocystis exedens]PCC70774.1 6-phosphogluconolactonase [Nannocystis exedens]SFE03094.1 6-phosphogluconolactonase [Nannocystis exedens]